MDSKKEVEQSKDPRTDQDFPGYPHYPAKEDIMDQRTDIHRVDLDVERLAAGQNKSGLNQRFADQSERNSESKEHVARREPLADERNEEIGTPQNVSDEDLGRQIPGTDLNEASKGKGNEESGDHKL